MDGFSFLAQGFNQNIEVPVTRDQNDFIYCVTFQQGIYGDSDIPVTLGRTICALNKWFEFYGKSNGTQDVLKLVLFAVSAVDRIGKCFDDFSGC